MSRLEDFSDGEAFWERLMAAPTFRDFINQTRTLSSDERDTIILFHAIREKQAAGNWADWTHEDREEPRS
jgi:hypothetical protein